MYRRTVSRRFTQMNVHFLLMNIKRCNPPPPPPLPRAPHSGIQSLARTSLQCWRLGWAKPWSCSLCCYVVASIFDFMTVEDWGESSLREISTRRFPEQIARSKKTPALQAMQEQAGSKNKSQAQASAFVVKYHLFTVLSLQCNV